MLQTLPETLGAAAVLMLGLEVLYFVLRKRVPTFRLRVLYHLWVVNMGALLVLRSFGTDYPRLWQATAASAVLLTTLALFAMVDSVILQRSWNLDGGPIMPKDRKSVV